MSLTQLQAFVMAATLNTFTAAAAELKMSQPAVSDLIRRLEQELQTALFHRGTRSLVLTAAGEQLLPHAQQAVASAEQGRQAVLSQLSLQGGSATFGLLRNADFYLKSDLAVRFHQRYPSVKIRLIGQNSAETAEDVASGVLEAGLVTLPVDDDGLEVVPVARDEVVYVTAEAARAIKPVSIEGFCGAPLVLYDAHYSTTDPARRQLNERAQMAGLRVDPAIEVEFLTTALTLVREGYGDTIICRAALAPLRCEDLHIVSFAQPLYDTLALVKRRGSLMSPATREMVRMALGALVQHQDSTEGTAEVIASQQQLARLFGPVSIRP